MHKNWKWNLHGHLSTLPFTLLYALWCFFGYGARSWGFRNGVLVCIGPRLGTMIPGTGAQTIGSCEVYADSHQMNRDDLHVHENGHIVQQHVCAFIGAAVTPIVFAAVGWSPAWGIVLGSLLGTPIWGVAYGACFAWKWLKLRAGWRTAYRSNPFEEQCYVRQAAFLGGDALYRARFWK